MLMDFSEFLPYLLVMSGVTYLIRALPFALIKQKIQNRFIHSFLYYVPYTVLAAMTFPAILYATNSIWSATAGLITALFLAYCGRALLSVAIGACTAVFLTEAILLWLV